MNVVEYVLLLHVVASSRYKPRSGTAGSPGSTMPNFLRNHQMDFQTHFPSLQFHQKWMSVPLSLHPLCLKFSILAILTDTRWNIEVILIFICLMIKDVEHCLRCFSVIMYSSVENSLFSSVPNFYRVIWFPGVQLLVFFAYIAYQSSIGCKIVGKISFSNLLVAVLSY